MITLSSHDGTTIAYDKQGAGPALILVDGALTVNDPGAQQSWSHYLRQLGQALADGRRGDAAALYLRFVGTPAEQVDGMRRTPSWPGVEAVAPTLAYDHAAIMGEPWSVPAGLAARVSVPALVMVGDASLPFMPDAARALSQAIPQGQLRILKGQAHGVNPGVLAPVLAEFF
jgi:pimeloyl-ACP methyl ester carboxylesterase